MHQHHVLQKQTLNVLNAHIVPLGESSKGITSRKNMNQHHVLQQKTLNVLTAQFVKLGNMHQDFAIQQTTLNVLISNVSLENIIQENVN